MTNERAIEILDPEHRGHYESIEPVNEACRIGMNAIKRVHELEAENAELHKALDEIKVFGLEMKNGEVDMTVGSDTFNYITAMLVQMLEQNNAKNFLTTAIEVGNQKYSVTVQKNGGKTPSEELSELKTENAALRERLDKAVELPCKVGDKVYCIHGMSNPEMLEWQVNEIHITDHNYMLQLGHAGTKDYKNEASQFYGKWWFTELEAAEARLAELKGGKE